MRFDPGATAYLQIKIVANSLNNIRALGWPSIPQRVTRWRLPGEDDQLQPEGPGPLSQSLGAWL